MSQYSLRYGVAGKNELRLTQHGSVWTEDRDSPRVMRFDTALRAAEAVEEFGFRASGGRRTWYVEGPGFDSPVETVLGANWVKRAKEHGIEPMGSKVIGRCTVNGVRWMAQYEVDENGDRVWIHRGEECLGTFEGVEVDIPEKLVNLVEEFELVVEQS